MFRQIYKALSALAGAAFALVGVLVYFHITNTDVSKVNKVEVTIIVAAMSAINAIVAMGLSGVIEHKIRKNEMLRNLKELRLNLRYKPARVIPFEWLIEFFIQMDLTLYRTAQVEVASYIAEIVNLTKKLVPDDKSIVRLYSNLTEYPNIDNLIELIAKVEDAVNKWRVYR